MFASIPSLGHPQLLQKMPQRAVAWLSIFFPFITKLVLRHNKLQRRRPEAMALASDTDSYSLSWRLAVETNNVYPWRTVPQQCFRHVKDYMKGGQYELDIEVIKEQILGYVNGITLLGDGLDAWILDVDDTCISNLRYYENKRFGCDPFDSTAFKAWMVQGKCPAIHAILVLFKKLVEKGFKVFLITGRDQKTFGQTTTDNLRNEGFIGYHRLILRSPEYKGQSAVKYKSEIRRQMEGEGYRIWGNVGDQWSDLQGDCLGKRIFKLPNPMTRSASAEAKNSFF